MKVLLILFQLLITQIMGFMVQNKFVWPQSQSQSQWQWQSQPHNQAPFPKRNDSSSLNLLWFGNDEKNKSKKEETKNDNPKQSRSKMGSTANTMENFKQSQELGKKTSALLNELAAASVEGNAAGGKIKVIVDGQQRPKLVEVDEDYFSGIGMEDLTEALTVAMQDAHDKSTQLMEERMSGLYADLGLPPTKH